ncbi:MAG: helix-turn-helix domain-containing protein [Lentisphaeraceae bacterium]|nr:helix-turn-helix domain-containing protein [Lentisphaeraceae bacterium]
MKYLNWGALTDDLLEILVMNQTQLAKQCRVTQQSVSNWKTGVRSPGVYARHVLRELAKEAKVTLDDYKTIPYQKPVGKTVSESSSAVSEDIMNFAQRLSILPKRQREKIMDMAEFMISRGN